MNPYRSFALIIVLISIMGCASPNGPSIPGNPQYAIQLISQTTTRGLARDVWVTGDTAYVADDEYGVTMWDVSNLQRPVMVDSMQTLARVFAIAHSPVTGLIMTQEATNLGGVRIYNAATKRSLYDHGGMGSNAFRFIEVSHDTLLLAESESDGECQFLKFFKDNTDNYNWSSDLHGAYLFNEGVVRSLELDPDIDSNYVYFAHSQSGITILQVDYSRIGFGFSGTVLGRIDTPGMARDLVLSRDRNHLFVADNQSGLQVIDVSNKTRPRIVGASQPPNVNDVLTVRALGDTAIFIEQYRGIYAVDCYNPSSPRYFGSYDTPDPQGIFIRESDRTIFLADLDLGLLILKFRQ